MAMRHEAVLAKETRKEVHPQTPQCGKRVKTFIDPTVCW